MTETGLAPNDAIDIFKVRPIRQARAILAELDAASGPALGSLHHVITLLIKEQAGFVPIFGVDFEVLHAYLFPSIQRKSSNVSPSLAAYVLEHPSARLVLPPGTVLELLQYAATCCQVERHFDTLLQYKAPGHLSRQELDELLKMYGRVVERDASPDLLRKADSMAFVVSEALAEIVKGFERLSMLISQGRFSVLETLVDNFDNILQESAILMPAFAAQIAAGRAQRCGGYRNVEDRRQPSSASSHRNVEDSRNVATTLVLDRAQVSRWSAMGPSQRTSVAHYTFQLLTNTRPILELNLEQYGSDYLARQLGVRQSHLDGRRHPWIACPLDSAAVYLAIRSNRTKVAESLRDAYAHAADIHFVEGLINAIDAAQTSSRGDDELATLRGDVERILTTGAGSLYLKLRKPLQQSYTERRNWRGVYPDVPPLSYETENNSDFVDALERTVWKDRPVLSPEAEAGRSLGTASWRDSLLALGVRTKSFDLPGSDQASRHAFSCTYDGQELLRVDVWPADNFISVVIPILLDFKGIVDLFNDMRQPLAGAKGEVRAEYEVAAILEEAGSKEGVLATAPLQMRNKVLMQLGAQRPLSVTDLYLPGLRGQLRYCFTFPTTIAIESEIGDVYVVISSSVTEGGHHIVCNIAAQEGLELLLLPFMKAAHPWKLFPLAIASFEEAIRSLIRTLQKSCI